MVDLKDFRKEIMAINPSYRVRVRSVSFSSMGLGTHKHLSVVDKDGKFIAGSGANVYSAEHIKKHSELFDLLRDNKGQVFDGDSKVLF